MIDKTIFREYDIRGIVGQHLTLNTVYSIARAFAGMAAEKSWSKILVGRDNRESSPAIRETVIRALLDSGCDVIDIGMVLSPMFYFAARHLDIKAGLMITASHNSPEYNGMKVYLGETTIYGQDIQELYTRAKNEQYQSGNNGRLERTDINEAYFSMIKSKITLGPHRQKVVVDCGNGTASLFAPQLLRELGCQVVELYCDSDPKFPNHQPDPVSVENCQDLIKAVNQEGADLGIGLDGDGDRLGVVDRNGNIIWGDILMILFWREILPRYPETCCIVEVKCSQSLIDEIVHLGGKPLIYKTGHSLIKAKMKEIGAVFTGEMSGHMFFADEYFGFDDALYAAARLLRILSNSPNDISELLADINRYYSTPEIRLRSTEDGKFSVVQQILEYYQPRQRVIDVDGARIIYPDGWGLVRASNTGPNLIFRCEGSSPQALERIYNELSGFLRGLGIDVDHDL